MSITIRAEESDRRAFSRWLEECLERCDIDAASVHEDIGLDYNNVYRYRTGRRNPNSLFLARTLMLIKREGGFEHPGEVVHGLRLLDVSPEEIPQLIKDVLEESRERKDFLTWLEEWDHP